MAMDTGNRILESMTKITTVLQSDASENKKIADSRPLFDAIIKTVKSMYETSNVHAGGDGKFMCKIDSCALLMRHSCLMCHFIILERWVGEGQDGRKFGLDKSKFYSAFISIIASEFGFYGVDPYIFAPNIYADITPYTGRISTFDDLLTLFKD